MPRLRNTRTGVVVNVSNETADRLKSERDEWEAVKSTSSRKKSDDK
jgi:hypothetical protein